MAPLLRYAWASPASIIGLVLAIPAMCLGARARVIAGAIEVGGGALGRWAARRRFGAITFGHVILGIDRDTLDCCRAHEHVHVRQYERWGFLLLPLYLASSAIELARGRDPYRDNVFEREARAKARLNASRDWSRP